MEKELKRALVILGLIGLTGCSKTIYEAGTLPPLTTAPTTTATVPASNDYVDVEEFFVQYVKDEYPYAVVVPDEEILATGWATCQALDAGVSPTAIASELVAASEGNERIALFLTIISGGATGILCPEHLDAWSV